MRSELGNSIWRAVTQDVSIPVPEWIRELQILYHARRIIESRSNEDKKSLPSAPNLNKKIWRDWFGTNREEEQQMKGANAALRNKRRPKK